jgi:hypothetical protein
MGKQQRIKLSRQETDGNQRKEGMAMARGKEDESGSKNLMDV